MPSFKQILPRSLFGRSLLIIVVPTVILQLVLAIVFLDNHWTKTTTRLSESVVGDIEYVLSSYEEDSFVADEPFQDKVFNSFEMKFFITPASEENITDVIENEGIWARSVRENLEDSLSKQIFKPFDVKTLRDERVLVRVIDGDNALNFTFPDRRLFTSSSYIFLYWMVLSSLLLTFIAILFMRNQVRPIRRLAIAAEKFGRGQDIPSFKPTGSREIRQATKAFMAMKERLARQIEQRTAMLAGISHDLRTPLTRLKLNLSMMPSDEDTEDMKNDISEMDKMIHGYLDFVRGEGDEAIRHIQLSEFLQDICDSYKSSSVVFENRIGNTLYYPLRENAFTRCLNNLLGNALRHADKAEVVLERDEDNIYIFVEDNGKGIASEHYEDVFKPFFRLDDARKIDGSGGVGLGLSIAQDIILSHGGQIKLSQGQSLGGLKVCLELPL